MINLTVAAKMTMEVRMAIELYNVFINDDGYVMRGESHDIPDIGCENERKYSMTMEVRMPIKLYNVELMF